MNNLVPEGAALRFPFHERLELSVEQVLATPALLIDGLVIILVSMFTGVLFHLLEYGVFGDVSIFAAYGTISAVLFCGAIRVNRRANFSGPGRARTAIMVWSLSFLFLVVLAFGLKISSQFSRGTTFAFYFTGLIAVTASRVMVPQLLSRWTLTNAYRGVENIIVSPMNDQQAKKMKDALMSQGADYFRTIEYDDNYADPANWILQRKRLVQSVFDTARTAQPGAIFLFQGRLPPQAVTGLLAQLRIIPRAIYLVPEEIVSNLLQYEIRPVGRTIAVEIQKSPLSRFEAATKRCLDIFVAGVGLAFLAPVFAAVAIAIKLDSEGPIFFRQSRFGYRGQPFKIVKFRTMRVLEDGDTVTQATKNDRRVTKVGAFLRKSSLDELPQLWNVLRGDMSIVGPRPHAVAHDKLYANLIDNYEVRQHVRPGITGWAQVNGLRGETPNLELMYRRIELDIWYATNCSLLLDTKILIRTVFEVVRQNNAY